MTADPSADPVAIAVQIAGIFSRLGVRYVLGGSLASVTFGEPRATLDVDLAADLHAEQVEAFVAAVAELLERACLEAEVG